MNEETKKLQNDLKWQIYSIKEDITKAKEIKKATNDLLSILSEELKKVQARYNKIPADNNC